MDIEIEIGRIVLHEKNTTPVVEVYVHFEEKVDNNRKSANVIVYLDWKDYKLSEIKAEAIKKAKEFAKEF